MNSTMTIAAKTNDTSETLTGQAAIDWFFAQPAPAGAMLAIHTVQHNGVRYVSPHTAYRPSPDALAFLLGQYDQTVNGRHAEIVKGKLCLSRRMAFFGDQFATIYWDRCDGPEFDASSKW